MPPGSPGDPPKRRRGRRLRPSTLQVVAATIQIPNSATIRGARGFLQNADWSLEGGETVIRFHERWSHMQPWIIAALAAWGLEARSRGVAIRIENGHTARYAWRFGLAEYLGVDPGLELTPHEEAGRFVALRTIATREDHGTLMADVVPLLHLSGEPEQARAVHYVLSEMIRNVREHSDSPHGAVVCAQYYRGGDGTRPYVSVGVADTGRGIRESLRWNYPDIAEDGEALLKAIQPGVTGAVATQYGRSNNAGAGLFYTRRLAEVSGQYFGLGSGAAIFRTSTAQKRPPDNRLAFEISPFPGTLVSVNFALEREVDFDDFLQATGREFSHLDDRLREDVAQRVRFT